MNEFSVRTAHNTPTVFSDDTITPFEDIGMGAWSDDQIAEFFEGKIVADVGSGQEGIARRLYSIFGNTKTAPTVININPQFTDWRMKDTYVNGELKSSKQYKQDDLECAIRITMGLTGEDCEGYFGQRTALAGLVQQLPFASETVDVVTSTWAFPHCLYGKVPEDSHMAGYAEILRVLKSGGVARLSPIGSKEHTGIRHILEEVGAAHTVQFISVDQARSVLEVTKSN